MIDAVRRTLGAARLVLANSAGTAERVRALGGDPRVVHLGTDVTAIARSGQLAGAAAGDR